MYEQLQDILNKCIEKWRNKYYSVIMVEWCLLWKSEAGKNIFVPINIHELFSKDSWLIEFVEWIEVYCEFWKTDNNIRLEHYNNMSDMKAEEKVKYFIDNVVI